MADDREAGSRWVDAGEPAEIEGGKRLRVQLGRFDLVLLELAGAVVAVDNLCPHRGGPMSKGQLIGDVLTCPLHFWKFNLRTGACVDHPGCSINTYEVRVDDGRILVRV